MRTRLLLVGVVVTILGAILSFVPLAPGPSSTVHTDSSLAFFSESAGGFSVTGGIPTTVSWSATESVQILAINEPGPECTISDFSSPNGSGYSAPGTLAGSESGTSGSLTFEQPEGGCMVLAVNVPAGSNPVNVTYKVTTAESTFGTLLLVPGIVLVIAALILGKPGNGPPAPASPAQPAPTDTTRQHVDSPMEPR